MALNTTQRKYFEDRLNTIFREKVQEICSKYPIPQLTVEEKISQIRNGVAILREDLVFSLHVGLISSFTYTNNEEVLAAELQRKVLQQSLTKLQLELKDRMYLGDSQDLLTALVAIEQFAV